MPFLEDQQLREIEEDLKKNQVINEGLIAQLDLKNHKIHKQQQLFYYLLAFAGVLFLALVYLGSNKLFTEKNQLQGSNEGPPDTEAIQVLNEKIRQLTDEGKELAELKELYLARNFINSDTIYSVQIKSLSENKINLVSNTFTNTIISKNHPFLSFSLGVFETRNEARLFQKQIQKLGFDDAFVASYKNGKRIRIEPKNDP